MLKEFLKPASESTRENNTIIPSEAEQTDSVKKVIVPDPEVCEKPVRRKFTVEYKRLIVDKASKCSDPGSIGQLLRKEGLYGSSLAKWKKQMEDGSLSALEPKQRGPKKPACNPFANENKELSIENQMLKKRLAQAVAIIDIQKKISELLGISLETTPIITSNLSMQ
jgi:transposase